jgi:hypothetical protein
MVSRALSAGLTAKQSTGDAQGEIAQCKGTSKFHAHVQPLTKAHEAPRLKPHVSANARNRDREVGIPPAFREVQQSTSWGGLLVAKWVFRAFSAHHHEQSTTEAQMGAITGCQPLREGNAKIATKSTLNIHTRLKTTEDIAVCPYGIPCCEDASLSSILPTNTPAAPRSPLRGSER